MISSFKCKDTQQLYEIGDNRRFAAVARVALRKLDMIAAATKVETLRVPPRNRLEQLHGDRQGQWSIRVNDQWRICFRWSGMNAEDVEIVDYLLRRKLCVQEI
ncbi:MAG: type II toxin-antitoxin system RelE/ParE family toxin [Kiritimatiellae bacterium]|nr:type II toxin-antitoxin system RelE/ParE family toxin [Kiritimatiellia bacterium]